MKERGKVIVGGLLLLAFAWGTEAASRKIVSAALFGPHLVRVMEDGAVDAWSVETRARDEKLTAALSARSIERTASDGRVLWGLSRRELLKWSAERDAWIRQSELPPETAPPIALLSLGGDPVVVYPGKVVRPLVGRTYTVPRLEGRLQIDSLRLLATYVAPPNLWFGTGEGEWGGHLVRLDTESGRWFSHYDGLHYVTGITQSASDKVTVTWSMSHMLANTMVRVHDLETNVLHEGSELQDRYYQAIAYSSASKTLYGIEQNQVVEVRLGKPYPVADMGELPYEPEPRAVGVVPGILSLFPLADGSLLIVHRSTSPMLLRKGKLLRFTPHSVSLPN